MENNNQNNNNIWGGGQIPPTPQKEPTAGIRPQGKIGIVPIRTFQDDVKQAISNDNISLVKIAVAEAKKKEQESETQQELSPENGKNKTIIILSFVMLVLGGLGFVGAWYYTSSSPKQEIAAPLPHKETIIPYDEEFAVAIRNNERKELLDGLTQAAGKKYDNDTSLVYMPVSFEDGSTTSLLSTEAFFSLLNARVPGQLVRAFDQKFMFGLAKTNVSGLTPFILLKADSFNRSYAGMLEWEPAMADDIGDMFFAKQELLAPQMPQDATTSEALPPRYILADSLAFKDEVVNNRDVRALRTPEGKLLMYYAFISDKLVLIARDFSVIDEANKRLATSQFRQ